MNLVSRTGRKVRAAVAALLVVVVLVACTDEADPEEKHEVEVSGDFGSVPVVTFEPPLPLADASVETLVEGDGRKLAADEPVLLSLTAYDGDSGELVEDREVGVARTFMLTPEDVGEDLFDVLTGSREGSRLLLRQPVDEGGEEHMLVLVVDVRYTQARGQEVDPASLPDGLPTVTLDEDGAPSIEVPDSPPPDELVVEPLIRGGGPQVRPGQEVILQYTGVEWQSGEIYDSTWEGGKVPQTVLLDETFKGLRDGLVDQTVGSQVLLVIPPGLAHGTETLVLVVDILATSGGSSDTVVSPETDTPTAEESDEASETPTD
ncbi:FKBP-type peptidyl-prolyl cis-trans isomerase [Georgenia halophila]|uniref:Peptidyl-prolyl cis-trans isomerase n=1 Tax=Georgenia halophila TaxID=620889 RepID=A0ABP8L532_9MICO